MVGALVLALAAAVGARAEEVGRPVVLSSHATPGARFMGIRFHGALALAPRVVDGITLGGLSGLAWDEDEGLLYAVSDRGSIFHLRPRIEDGTLVGVEAVAAHRLRDQRGRALRGRAADAEALAMRDPPNGKRGDSRLVVSYEGFPRVTEHFPDGRYRGVRPLPAHLGHPGAYASGNQALEAMTMHPRMGTLVAPERPLAGESADVVPITSLAGEEWTYRLFPYANASLVDMATLADGSLLTLERAYGPLYFPLVISLRHVAWPFDAKPLRVDTYAVLDSSRGFDIDNFEGVALHRDNHVFLVSDDNFHPLQRTLLVYLELVQAGAVESIFDVPDGFDAETAEH
ncbi:MAG: esterase-like activity of phytase family protein [Chromatiales bacterium]|nr:esterase-like activity of phytase family protein [Chromatiales bacterium]